MRVPKHRAGHAAEMGLAADHQQVSLDRCRHQRLGRRPVHLRALDFPAGSMGPKVDAACRFVELTGGVAAIGTLDDAVAILRGEAGTIITPSGEYDGGAATRQASPPLEDRGLLTPPREQKRERHPVGVHHRRGGTR